MGWKTAEWIILNSLKHNAGHVSFFACQTPIVWHATAAMLELRNGILLIIHWIDNKYMDTLGIYGHVIAIVVVSTFPLRAWTTIGTELFARARLQEFVIT